MSQDGATTLQPGWQSETLFPTPPPKKDLERKTSSLLLVPTKTEDSNFCKVYFNKTYKFKGQKNPQKTQMPMSTVYIH